VGAIALVSLLAACGTSGTSDGGGSSSALKTGPGVDVNTKTINLGVLTPLSGPVADPIGKPLTRGQETYFSALNDKGGIDGWKINIKDWEKDTKYDPQTHVQQYNAIIDQVAFIAQSLGSPTTLAIQKLADQGNVLIGAATQSGSWVTDKVMAVIGTPYSVDIANGVDYVVNKLGKKDAKIALVYQNDEYGQDGQRGYKAALDAFHFNDVGQITFNATDTVFTSQIQALAAAGAQYVFLVATPSPAGKIVGTGAAGKYLPQWVFQGPAWSSRLMTSDGTATGTPTPLAGVLPGKVLVLGFEAQWGDQSIPGMKQFLADHDKYAPDQPPDGYYMYGYCEALFEAAVIKKAIASGDLTRAGFVNAKLNLGTVDFGGLIPSHTYTPDLGPASRQTDIAVVDTATPGFLKVVQPYFVSDPAKNLKFPYS
jgi:ABC-type branched-subunit amino acid transport system substrate-binding protein